MLWKHLMFWFTESLELNPQCDKYQHVYEEIVPESHLKWRVWITEKKFWSSDQEMWVLMCCWWWKWMLLSSFESTCCDLVSRIFWNISTRIPDYNDSHLRTQYTSNYRTVYFINNKTLVSCDMPITAALVFFAFHSYSAYKMGILHIS
jgi:hypothetical protein